MNNTGKILLKYYKVAPSSIQEYLLGDSLRKAVDTLSKKHSLSEEQSRLFEADVTMVILGVTDLADLSRNLMENLNIDQNKAEDILKDTDRDIFADIRHGLNVVHGYEEESDEDDNDPNTVVTEMDSQIDTTSKLPEQGTPVNKSVGHVSPEEPKNEAIVEKDQISVSKKDPYREPIED